MKTLILIIFLSLPTFLHSQEKGVFMRIQNKGQYFIKEYEVTVNNKKYKFSNIKKNHYSEYQEIVKTSYAEDLWLTWSVIKFVIPKIRKNYLETVVRDPLHNRGRRIGSLTGKYKLIVNIKKQGNYIEEIILKE